MCESEARSVNFWSEIPLLRPEILGGFRRKKRIHRVQTQGTAFSYFRSRDFFFPCVSGKSVVASISNFFPLRRFLLTRKGETTNRNHLRWRQGLKTIASQHTSVSQEIFLLSKIKSRFLGKSTLDVKLSAIRTYKRFIFSLLLFLSRIRLHARTQEHPQAARLLLNADSSSPPNANSNMEY